MPNFTGLADSGGVLRPGMRGLALPGLSYGGPSAEYQAENAFRPALQAYENQGRSSFTYNPGGSGPGGSGAANVFSTLHNVKNPDVDAGVTSILSRIAGLETDPKVNTNVLKSNTKSTALAGRIGGQYQNLDAAIKDNSVSIEDFVRGYAASQPEAEGYQQQESANIGRYFGEGGKSAFLGDLNHLDEETSKAAMQAVQRAVGLAGRHANAARLMGNDTYVDKTLADTIAGVRVGEALRRGQAAKENYLTAGQAALNLTGARGNLLENLLRRNMLPTQFGQQVRGTDLAQLSQLGALENANTQYTMDSPEALLARRLALTGDASGIDLRNSFYGLSKPYEPNYEGGGPIMRPGGRGGGFGYPLPNLGYGGDSNVFDASTGSPVAGPRPSPQDAAIRAYQATAGVSPINDPNFSPELWQWSLSQTMPRGNQRYPNTPSAGPGTGWGNVDGSLVGNIQPGALPYGPNLPYSGEPYYKYPFSLPPELY